TQIRWPTSVMIVSKASTKIRNSIIIRLSAVNYLMNLFDATFTHEPLSPAIRFGRREITYGELRAETLKMAQVINSLHAASGERVALLLHDSPEFVEAFIATCLLGAIPV